MLAFPPGSPRVSHTMGYLQVLDLLAFTRANSYFFISTCLSAYLSIIYPLNSVSNTLLSSTILYHLSHCSRELQRPGQVLSGYCPMEAPACSGMEASELHASNGDALCWECCYDSMAMRCIAQEGLFLHRSVNSLDSAQHSRPS